MPTSHGQPANPPAPRLSDAERDRAVHSLTDHYVAGRLTETELDERMEAAMHALTADDLRPLFVDLPGGSPVIGPGFRSPARPDATPGAGISTPAATDDAGHPFHGERSSHGGGSLGASFHGASFHGASFHEGRSSHGEHSIGGNGSGAYGEVEGITHNGRKRTVKGKNKLSFRSAIVPIAFVLWIFTSIPMWVLIVAGIVAWLLARDTEDDFEALPGEGRPGIEPR